jgi:glycosyltransferase involved in cell wall biosynthesis
MRLGNLDVQLAVVRRLGTASAIYAANEGDLRLLAAVRRGGRLPLAGRLGVPLVGRLRVPLVVLFHHLPSRKQRAWVRGVDMALCMSARVAEALIDLGLPPTRVRLVHWGPDLEFPGYDAVGPVRAGPVVSVGKSGRDTATLLAALRSMGDSGTPPQALVYAFGESESGGGVPPYDRPDSCQVVSLPPARQLPLETALAEMRRAAVVAIPLVPQERGLVGLTELLDALALGKPVIMTRTPLVDIDIEAVGCGLFVNPCDVRGWVAALRRLLSDYRTCVRMGQAGRAFVESRQNYQRFCGEVVSVFEEGARISSASRAPCPPAAAP